MKIRIVTTSACSLALGTLLLAGCGGSNMSNPNPNPSQNPSGPFMAKSQWTWVGGSYSGAVNEPGYYGTMGTAAAINTPGARRAAASWTDSSGNFWLFGGIGFDANGNFGLLDDLWEFSPSTKMWTWVSGPDTVPAYNTLKATAPSGNMPSARYAATTWTDKNGNLWLFGGDNGSVPNSYVSNPYFMNDLWEFNPKTQVWTMVSGSSSINAAGVYGTQGIAAAGNAPGAREAAAGAIDASGNLWLFGGFGYSTTTSVNSGTPNIFQDLWMFNPSTKEWTWMSGSPTSVAPTYGTQGVAAASNVPGARANATLWTDASGNVWLWGGSGAASSASEGNLSDLWQFDPQTMQWTWIGGPNTVNAAGVYGTLSTPAATNIPGARNATVTWTDASGNLWLFGGEGMDTSGNTEHFSDLWYLNLATKTWTWIAGSNTENNLGNYGNIGIAAASNLPSGRDEASGWMDANGNLWLFGGDNGPQDSLNDLWVYQP